MGWPRRVRSWGWQERAEPRADGYGPAGWGGAADCRGGGGARLAGDWPSCEEGDPADLLGCTKGSGCCNLGRLKCSPRKTAQESSGLAQAPAQTVEWTLSDADITRELELERSRGWGGWGAVKELQGGVAES